MFEDLSAVPTVDTTTPPEGLVVSGHSGGGVMIRQRSGDGEEPGCIVVPPEQAESLIAAIRRHLNK